jgi:hypothetical protein
VALYQQRRIHERCGILQPLIGRARDDILEKPGKAGIHRAFRRTWSVPNPDVDRSSPDGRRRSPVATGSGDAASKLFGD